MDRKLTRLIVTALIAVACIGVGAQGAPGQIAPTAGVIADDGQGNRLYLTGGRLIFETPRGWFWMGGNEEGCVSKGDDPCKVRLSSSTGHNCISFNKNHPLNPFDQQELGLLCGSATEDDDRAFPSGGGQITFSATRKWTGGDGAMRKKAVISPAYQADGEPRVYLYPNLGPFAEGVPAPAPSPQPSPAPPPPSLSAIQPGDFNALTQYFGFESGDYDYYITGRMTWDAVVAEMVRRARPQ